MIDNRTQELPNIHFSQSTSVTLFIAIITISFILLGLVIGFLLVKNNKRSQLITIIPANPTVIPTQLTPTIIPTIAPTSGLFPDYRVLTVPELGFSIHYPSEVVLSIKEGRSGTVMDPERVVFQFEGDTKSHEEMGISFSDGYVVGIYPLPNSDPLHDRLSFEEIVQNAVKATSAYEEIVEKPHETVLAGSMVFQFTSAYRINKKQITTHYIVQTKNGIVLKITKMYIDPKNLGYKKTIDQMLSSFKLIDQF